MIEIIIMFDYADWVDTCLVNHWWFPLWAVINSSHNCWFTLAQSYTVSWPWSTSICSYSHPITCRFFFLLLPVSHTILYVSAGSYFQWLQLQRHGGRTGVCIAAVSHLAAHWMKCQPLGWIRIQLHLSEVFVEPSLACVESWGRW